MRLKLQSSNSNFSWLPPRATGLFFIITLCLALSPSGRRTDKTFHGPHVDKQDTAYYWLRTYTDRIVEQEVLGLVLLGLVLFFTLTRRTLLPLVLYGFTQAFFALTAALKILIGKTYPPLGLHYNYGGWDRADYAAMASPSGHATTAFILTACALLLLATYTNHHWTQYRRWYCIGWSAMVVVALATSLALGFHWFTDLVVGAASGAYGVSLLLAFSASAAPKIAGRLDNLVFRRRRSVVK